MANGKTHMLVGGMLVSGLYVVDKKLIHKEDLKVEEFIGSFLFGMVGGIMADWLEPATDPNHRQFFHSVVFAGIMLFGSEKIKDFLKLDEAGRKHFDWFISAYGSHLMLDLRTPKGLPFIYTR